MNKKMCGYCEHWRCDDPLHLIGHCTINRIEGPEERMYDICKKCKKYRRRESSASHGLTKHDP